MTEAQLRPVVPIPSISNYGKVLKIILQQQYSFNFINTLLAGGGDGAYVPLTAVYSFIFDTIVEPQAGTSASGINNDSQGAGVMNNVVQKNYAGQPAGSFYTREGMLFDLTAFVLAVDARAKPRPAKMEDLNLTSISGTYPAPR